MSNQDRWSPISELLQFEDQLEKKLSIIALKYNVEFVDISSVGGFKSRIFNKYDKKNNKEHAIAFENIAAQVNLINKDLSDKKDISVWKDDWDYLMAKYRAACEGAVSCWIAELNKTKSSSMPITPPKTPESTIGSHQPSLF